MLTEPLDVGNQVPGGVCAQVGSRFAGVRPALAAAALIEEHDAIAFRVEQAPDLGLDASAGPAVQEDCRLA